MANKKYPHSLTCLISEYRLTDLASGSDVASLPVGLLREYEFSVGCLASSGDVVFSKSVSISLSSLSFADENVFRLV